MEQQTFERNEFYESLILLERDEPKRYANMSEATRRTVEYYKQAKLKGTNDVN